jgi:hypothetical protein
LKVQELKVEISTFNFQVSTSRIEYARHHSAGVRRVQAPQLQHDEEQEEDDGTARDEEVLSVLPEASAAQGAKVSGGQ